MAESRFYWIKLKLNMLTSKTVDFLMSQKDGANYVILYQMLCLLTINSNGELADYIGEVIIPFDEAKIQRDTKYFNIDTIRVALGLYQKLGLVYVQENGILKIADFENLIGSESGSAKRVREYRERQRLEVNSQALQCNKNVTQNVTQENRYKNIDNRYEDIDINNNISTINSINILVTPEEQPISKNAQIVTDEEEIFNYWNAFGIVKHQTLTEKILKVIKKALSLYGIEKIKEGIANYAKVYLDKKYFFSYKWTLEEFLKQANALPEFFTEGNKWKNYIGSRQCNGYIISSQKMDEGWFKK